MLLIIRFPQMDIETTEASIFATAKGRIKTKDKRRKKLVLVRPVLVITVQGYFPGGAVLLFDGQKAD